MTGVIFMLQAQISLFLSFQETCGADFIFQFCCIFRNKITSLWELIYTKFLAINNLYFLICSTNHLSFCEIIKSFGYTFLWYLTGCENLAKSHINKLTKLLSPLWHYQQHPKLWSYFINKLRNFQLGGKKKKSVRLFLCFF